EQIAPKVTLDRYCQAARITRPAHEPRLSFNHGVGERSDIAGNHRQAEAVAKKEHSALEDLGIRQDQHVGCLEVELDISVGDVVDVQDASIEQTAGPDGLLDPLPVVLAAAFGLSRDDQPAFG